MSDQTRADELENRLIDFAIRVIKLLSEQPRPSEPVFNDKWLLKNDQ
jgi:hypothetical protein